MPQNKQHIFLLPLLLASMLLSAQSNTPAPNPPRQTSLQRAANVVVTEYVQDNKAAKDKEAMDELLAAMMLAGMLPDEAEDPSELEDPEAGDNDQNANRRNQRDRRRRNDQRRRNNRNRQQRSNDTNRMRSRYNRTQKRADDASPTGPIV